MFALTPINPTAFDKLIGRTIHTRKMLKRQHVLRPLDRAERATAGRWPVARTDFCGRGTP